MAMQFGWGGAELAAREWDLIGDTFGSFFVAGQTAPTQGRTFRAWDVVRRMRGADLPKIRQETGDCFPAGTLVLMADGSEKPIQEVCEGDEVISHLNKVRRVVRRIEKPYTGPLIELQAAKVGRSVIATPDHRLLAFPHLCHKSTFQSASRDSMWTPIGSLTIGDRVFLPYGSVGGEYRVLIPQTAFWHPGVVVTGCIQDPKAQRGKSRSFKHQLPASVTVNESVGRLLGLFLAEGSCEEHRVRFSFSADERETLVKETQTLLYELFGLKSTLAVRHKNGSCIVVTCYSTALAVLIRELIPGNVYSKAVPQIIFQSPASVRLAVLKGWMDGDGHIKKASTSSWRGVGVTASSLLAADMQRLAFSCELSPSLTVRKRASHQRVAASVVSFATNGVATMYPELNIVNSRPRSVEMLPGGVGLLVKSLTSHYMTQGVVYCLEVEHDHSFIANGYAVHNCVAMACADVLNAIQVLEIAAGEAEQFHPIFSPYLYAAGRVKIGQNKLRGKGGSIGSWQAKAVETLGALRADIVGVPAYSGRLADRWGDDKGNWQEWTDEADDHVIRTTARITSWTQLVDAVANGYLCTIASDQGWEMMARSDGFHKRRGSWSHQMGIHGVSDDRKKPWVAISNNWGDVHGIVKDFETSENWPSGMLRVRPEDLDPLYKSGEVIAYSGFEGFPDRSNNWDTWSLI